MFDNQIFKIKVIMTNIIDKYANFLEHSSVKTFKRITQTNIKEKQVKTVKNIFKGEYAIKEFPAGHNTNQFIFYHHSLRLLFFLQNNL